jgi:U-box domain/CCCH-type zinc finger
VLRALTRGWHVHVWSWRGSLSAKYEALRNNNLGNFEIHYLDLYRDEFVYHVGGDNSSTSSSIGSTSPNRTRTQQQPCKFYTGAAGSCRKGDRCTHSHTLNHSTAASASATGVSVLPSAPPAPAAVRATGSSTLCTFFAVGTCNRGANCGFSHAAPVTPTASGQQQQQQQGLQQRAVQQPRTFERAYRTIPCRLWNGGAGYCRWGSDCNFLHSTTASEHTAATATAAATVEPPDEYMCPISAELMIDPVLSTLGYTYERAAIESWLDQRGTEPYSRLSMTSAQLVPNRVAKDLIEKWLAAHPDWNPNA